MFKILYGTYISDQKFDSIGFSLLRDLTKIWKKSLILKMSRIFMSHNNNIKKLFKKS